MATLRQSSIGAMIAAVVAIAGIGVGVEAAAATTKSGKPKICATKSDMLALNTRVLQTELMVAALSCEERTRYNAFVTGNQALLAARAKDLQAFFRRTYGSSGTTRLNQFVTRIANAASQESQKRADDYCQFADGLFTQTAPIGPADVSAVIAAEPWIASRHEVPPC